MPARLRPTAPIAPDAILVGDPGRALMLAQDLLEQPKMSNHARGLWGYRGETLAGAPLTIQATGMGGPSARVVLHDLAELGLRRAVRVGTCTTLGERDLGDVVVVGSASTGNEDSRVVPDPSLTAALEEQTGAGSVTALSLDTLHRHSTEEAPDGGDVVDMQTAALFAAAGELDVALAALLVVSETGFGATLPDEPLEAAVKRAGTAAAGALSPSS